MATKTFAEVLNQLATDKQLRTTNLYMLSRVDRPSMELLEQVWPTIPTQRRRDIMQELVEISEANFEVYFDPVFLFGLGDEDAEVRAASINGLWEHENPALIVPLIHLLRADPAVIVRAAAAIGLGRFLNLCELEQLEQNQATLIKEALLETIHTPREDIEVRRRALESIAYSSDTDVSQIIENAYYDENEKMQVSALFAMGRNADSVWVPQVVAELDSPNSELRFEAARACGELEAGKAVQKLIELVEQDPDLEVQEMAIWALGRIGGPAAREALEMYVESDVEALALAAEEAIDELNLFGGDDLLMYDFDPDDWDDLVSEADEEEDEI
jgi:HEAT repeat protein